MPTGTQAVTGAPADSGNTQDRSRLPEQNCRCNYQYDPACSLRELYFALREGAPSAKLLEQSRQLLREQLEAAESLSSDLPGWSDNLAEHLNQWVDQHTEQVGQKYQAYLESRAAGASRQYFTNRAHALYFLKSVAPTKLVDGAWLYGLLQRWRDPRFEGLIRIYLEELGDGLPDKNHVLLYRQLLASHGLSEEAVLSEGHYVQGTLQLALACHAEHFLPELIGYNQGYEQLPLHLLITAYELNELGIDPYYFTLHVTVDNAGTGHARKALQGLLDALPQVEDPEVFYRRVRNGYRLNELGESSLSVIQSFDLHQELIRCLAAKSDVGRFAHSDYCRLAGRTVNQWLSEPAQIPDFLKALEERGWIKRHHPVEESRFWKLIQGDRAEMFGVFSAYEQQLIHDWILGDLHKGHQSPSDSETGVLRISQPQSFRARQRLLRRGSAAVSGDDASSIRTPRPLLRQQHQEDVNDFNSELRELENELSCLAGKADIMDRLVPLLSPAAHHKPAGLMATRIFSQLFT